MQEASKWPVGWLRRRGVACFERALGRVAKERTDKGKALDGSFMEGVITTSVLPTAVACNTDHYLVFGVAGGIRWMTVNETARSFGLLEGGSLFS